MSGYSKYWSITMTRGVLAIAAGLFAFALPSLMVPFLVKAITIVFCVVVFSFYGIGDSILILITSRVIPAGRPGRLALASQGVLGLTCGILLVAVGIDWIHLNLFLDIAAAQALVIAMTQFITARRIHVYEGRFACYATSAVASGLLCALLMSRNLSDKGLICILFVYLGAIGLTLVTLSTLMLFAEHHGPAHTLRSR
jgi:hypothetical protein